MRSRIFEKYGRTDIGRYLVKGNFLPFLKIEDTFAIFSLPGKILALNDKLKIRIKGVFNSP